MKHLIKHSEQNTSNFKGKYNFVPQVRQLGFQYSQVL